MFNRKQLLNEVEYVLKAVETKTTIPILKGIHIATRNGICQLTGTDLEIAAVSGFPLDVPAFTMVANGRELRDTLKLIKTEQVSLLATEGGRISISAIGDSFSATVEGYDAFSYPELPGSLLTTMRLPAPDVLTLASSVKASISQDASRFTLNGALLDIDRGAMRFVATDGHRLSIAEAVTALPGKMRDLIKSDALAMLPLMAKGAEDIQFSANPDHLAFMSTSGTTVRGILQRKMTGVFPDYERVVPKTENLPWVFNVERAGFLLKVAAMAKIADGKPHAGTLAFDETGEVTIIASGDKQSTDKFPATMSSWPDPMEAEEPAEGAEVVEAEPGVKISINLNYMVDQLRVMDCDRVDLRIKDKTSAMMVTGKTGASQVSGVIMPMRI